MCEMSDLEIANLLASLFIKILALVVCVLLALGLVAKKVWSELKKSATGVK